ncbi:DUF1905 domain-containing protein [Streptomyces sp. NPDC048045]|uniref:DUF1905 domain-containing protein n=1 Tax=Streptomyces sp. NPDC048045 TaxID=3154710 RepID=UPI0034279167
MHKYPGKGGWTYGIRPRFAEFFGGRGPVKIRGTVEGRSFRRSFMAPADGAHKLPVKAEVRTASGRGEGDTVTVRLKERLSS